MPARLRANEFKLDEELRFHRELQARQGAGLATRWLRLERCKEDCRDMRRLNVIENLAKDLAYAGRTLRRSPVFTVAAFEFELFDEYQTSVVNPLRSSRKVLERWSIGVKSCLAVTRRGLSFLTARSGCVRSRRSLRQEHRAKRVLDTLDRRLQGFQSCLRDAVGGLPINLTPNDPF